jgi:glyoxylase-like metal-dependent hydrolase (beta-lactamase superfamily II)
MEPFTELRPGIRRLVAPNSSMMTGPGTNTYLFGVEEIAVLDPGPVIDSHLEAIQRKAGAPIRWVVVTHTHPDHSPAASVLAKETSAELIGIPAPVGAHQDESFQPDRVLADNDRLVSDEFAIRAIHTPGHASNHVCFHHEASDWVFTGDHVIDGSTVVINPPDGNMKQYIESLRRLRSMGCAALAPGHGELIHDPERAIDWIIEHRLEREARVVAALKANPNITTRELVPHVYKDVDKKLYGLAERSLLAHLIKLQEDCVATNNDALWVLGSV